MTDRETDREISRISRRGLLGAGAGAAAATLAGLSAFGNVHLAGAQEAGGAVHGSEGPAGEISADSLPPAAPGTKSMVIGFGAATSMGYGVGAGLAYSQGVFNATGGWVDVPMPLDVGARVVRIDAYLVSSGASGEVKFQSEVPSSSAYTTNIAVITTNAAAGIVQGTWTGSRTVAAGECLQLEMTGLSSSLMFAGAIVTYYPANPELYLLAAPVRVYDSRVGYSPNTGTKAPLNNAESRVVDCAYGSAVPAGARAALVNVTIVGTQSSGGYLSLWKNGIAWPGTSTVNWDHVGETVASTAVVAVDGSAKFLAQAGGGATDFIVDVVGYYS